MPPRPRAEKLCPDSFAFLRASLRRTFAIHSRDEEGDEGRKKYEDLNGLAIQLVKPGGLFVTCSCSGLISEEEFERYVIKGAHRNGRRLQFFNRTGAAPDHPVMSNCLDSRYLKVMWARVF